MEAMNCPKCGSVFMRASDPLCKSCMVKEEEIYDMVRDYIKENENCSVSEVASACEVSVKRVLRYVREGRIHATAGMAEDIVCSKCGKPILMGRMCEKCLLDTNAELNEMREEYKIQGRVFTHKNKKT